MDNGVVGWNGVYVIVRVVLVAEWENDTVIIQNQSTEVEIVWEMQLNMQNAISQHV